MSPIRRLIGWTMPRSLLVDDVLTMAAERDRWRRRAEVAERRVGRLADEAVAVAHRYAEQLEAEQARCDSLAADLDRLVCHGC